MYISAPNFHSIPFANGPNILHIIAIKDHPFWMQWPLDLNIPSHTDVRHLARALFHKARVTLSARKYHGKVIHTVLVAMAVTFT